jgi:hypothetical protein
MVSKVFDLPWRLTMEDSQPEVQSKSESANEKKREGNLTGKCLLRSSCLRNIRRELDALSRFIMAPGIADALAASGQVTASTEKEPNLRGNQI